nr:MAG TPA: hypothetical protein [Caudoviricetes sp.]
MPIAPLPPKITATLPASNIATTYYHLALTKSMCHNQHAANVREFRGEGVSERKIQATKNPFM